MAFSSNERVGVVLYNSMTGVVSEFGNFSHRHIGFDPEAFVQSAEEIAGAARKIAEGADEMRTIELTETEKNIFAQSAHGLVYDDELHTPITSSQLLEGRRYDDRGNILWNTLMLFRKISAKAGCVVQS